MTSPVQSALQLYLLSFNAARNHLDPHLFARHLFDALPPRHVPLGASSTDHLPDVIVVSLQELAGIAPAFLAGTWLAPYFDRISAAVHIAAQQAMHDDDTAANVYRHVLQKSVGMTAIMLFAKPHVADRIVSLQTAGVGLGFWEMGNKGAVGVRIGLASSDGVLELTFVAAHLAPMEYGVGRRNDDWANIVRRLVFEAEEGDGGSGKAADGAIPAGAADSEHDDRDDAGRALLPQSPSSPQGLYTPNAHVFFCGDLNYRTSDTPPLPVDTHTRFPRPGDPYAELLAADQLQRERRAGRALHGFDEAPIAFPPTYKYSFHHSTRPWAPHRWPSWCDRILFLPAPGLKPHRYEALPLLPISDHQPVALAAEVPWAPLVVEDDVEVGADADPEADAETIVEASTEPSVEASTGTNTLTSTDASTEAEAEAEAETATPAAPPAEAEPSPPTANHLRHNPPFPIDPTWRTRRSAARTRELVVGALWACVTAYKVYTNVWVKLALTFAMLVCGVMIALVGLWWEGKGNERGRRD